MPIVCVYTYMCIPASAALLLSMVACDMMMVDERKTPA